MEQLPKFSERLYHLLSELTLNYDLTVIVHRLLNNDIYSMMDLIKNNEEGYQFSYLQKGKEPEYTDSGKWSSKNRVRMKIGKLLRSVSKDSPDSHIEELSYIIKSEFIASSLEENNLEVKIVSGDDITYYYNVNNYYGSSSSSGTLHNSCMKDDDCTNYINFYSKLSDCELLVLLIDGKVACRALMWNANNQKYIDRIYYYNDTLRYYLKQYIMKNKWNYRAKDNSSQTDTRFFYVYDEYSGEYLYREVKLSRYLDKFDQFPYLDTFKFYDPITKMLSNYVDIPDDMDEEDFDYDEWEGYRLESCDGGYYQDGNHFLKCSISGNFTENYVRSTSSWLNRPERVVGVEYCIKDSFGSYIPEDEAFLAYYNDEPHIFSEDFIVGLIKNNKANILHEDGKDKIILLNNSFTYLTIIKRENGCTIVNKSIQDLLAESE